MTRARIGVIGLGWWATQFHLPSLISYRDAEVVAVADPDHARRSAAAGHFGIARAYRDHRELLDAGGVDGVVIAVPHTYHYEIARAALDAGVHVLLEKPMVLRSMDAWDLVERAQRRGLHLTVGYTYHHTRHAARAKRAFDDGELGELVAVSGLFTSWVEELYRSNPAVLKDAFLGYGLTGPLPETYADPAIAGGGQGQTQATHALGMLLWVTGARAVDVSAFMEKRELAVDVAVAISFKLESGAVGTMASTGSLTPAQPRQQELRYYGTEGLMLQELIQGTLAIHRADGTVEELAPLGEDELYPAHAPARSLVDLMLGRGENRAPGAPAAHVVEILEAAYASATDGRSVAIAAGG